MYSRCPGAIASNHFVRARAQRLSDFMRRVGENHHVVADLLDAADDFVARNRRIGVTNSPIQNMNLQEEFIGDTHSSLDACVGL